MEVDFSTDLRHNHIFQLVLTTQLPSVLVVLLVQKHLLTPQALREVIPLLRMMVENYVRQVVQQVLDNHSHHQDLRVLDLLVDLVVEVQVVVLVLVLAVQMTRIQVSQELLHL